MKKGKKSKRGAKPTRPNTPKLGDADFSIKTMLRLADTVDWSEEEKGAAEAFLQQATSAMDAELSVLEWISKCSYRIPIVRSLDLIEGKWSADIVGCGEPSIVGVSLEDVTNHLRRMLEITPGAQPAVWWQDAIPSGLEASFIVGIFHCMQKGSPGYSVICYDGLKKIVPLGSDLSRLMHQTFSAVPNRAFQSDLGECAEALARDFSKAAGSADLVTAELSQQIRKRVEVCAERILEIADAESYRIAMAGQVISKNWESHHEEAVETERTRHQQAMLKAEQKARKDREALERQLQGISKRSTELALRLNKERKMSAEAAEPRAIQPLGERVDALIGGCSFPR